MTTDQELRNRILERVYEIRHEKGWQKLPEVLNMPEVSEHVLGNIVGQLRDRGLVEWYRTMGGECRGAIKISSAGVEEMESRINLIPPVEILDPQMSSAHPTHTLILWFTFIAGVIFAALGALSVWLGSTGKTAFQIMGFNISTESVGIAGIALGAVLIFFTFRRVLKSVEVLQK